MTLDLAPGTAIAIDGQRYTVETHSTCHEVDFRLDLVRLVGPTPAHERWLAAVLPEPHLMLLERLEQDWMAPPLTSVVHDGEVYTNLYRGSAYLVRRTRATKAKEGRVDYALFRANSGRVILTMGHTEAIEAWVGVTLPDELVQLT